MKTTASTRTLIDLAKKGETVPEELAHSIARFISDLLTDHEQRKLLLSQCQQEVIDLAKANGELGMKVVDITLELKPDIDKLKKVVRLLLDSSTKELQTKMGVDIVDMIMEKPEKFNARGQLPEASPADLPGKPEIPPTEIDV